MNGNTLFASLVTGGPCGVKLLGSVVVIPPTCTRFTLVVEVLPGGITLNVGGGAMVVVVDVVVLAVVEVLDELEVVVGIVVLVEVVLVDVVLEVDVVVASVVDAAIEVDVVVSGTVAVVVVQ